jgi:hypothetical protein
MGHNIKTFKTFDQDRLRSLQEITDLIRAVDSGDVSSVRITVSQGGKAGDIVLSELEVARGKLGIVGKLTDHGDLRDLKALEAKRVTVSLVPSDNGFELVVDWGSFMTGVTKRYGFHKWAAL